MLRMHRVERSRPARPGPRPQRAEHARRHPAMSASGRSARPTSVAGRHRVRRMGASARSSSTWGSRARPIRAGTRLLATTGSVRNRDSARRERPAIRRRPSPFSAIQRATSSNTSATRRLTRVFLSRRLRRSARRASRPRYGARAGAAVWEGLVRR